MQNDVRRTVVRISRDRGRSSQRSWAARDAPVKPLADDGSHERSCANASGWPAHRRCGRVRRAGCRTAVEREVALSAVASSGLWPSREFSNRLRPSNQPFRFSPASRAASKKRSREACSTWPVADVEEWRSIATNETMNSHYARRGSLSNITRWIARCRDRMARLFVLSCWLAAAVRT